MNELIFAVVPAGHASSTKAHAQTKSYMLIMATEGNVFMKENVPNAKEKDSTRLSNTTGRAVLQLYDLSTYKVITNYSGFNPPAEAFTRASISRDGR